MARTTAEEVEAILVNDYDGRSLTPYIDSASILIDRVETCATAKGVSLSDTELEILERWISAHMYAISDRPYERRRTGNASGTFDGKTAMRLDATLYGQNAKLLDGSGCLASMDKRNKVTALWLGKPPSEQIDYIDRD